MDLFLPPVVDQIIDIALAEDLGGGDVTTRLTVPPETTARGEAIAKQSLVLSGGDVFARVMRRVDPRTNVVIRAADGSACEPGDVLVAVEGRTASLLAAERVALNFLQHLSGVATATRSFRARLPAGSKTVLTDTRKTTPGLRLLERRAVRHGGGRNHRDDLGGGILVKENHVAAAGSIAAAVRRCQDGAPHPLRIEVEVRSLRELEEAVAAGADAVLLDNMDPETVAKAVELARGRVFVEASGGVSLDSVATIAAAGVDAISIGALTHSARAADITFLLRSACSRAPSP